MKSKMKKIEDKFFSIAKSIKTERAADALVKVLNSAVLIVAAANDALQIDSFESKKKINANGKPRKTRQKEEYFIETMSTTALNYSKGEVFSGEKIKITLLAHYYRLRRPAQSYLDHIPAEITIMNSTEGPHQSFERSKES